MRSGVRERIGIAVVAAGACLLPWTITASAEDPTGGTWQTDAQWQSAFERSKRADAAFRVESLDEFKRITGYHQELVSDGITVHAFHAASGEYIRCVSVSSQRAFAQGAAPGAAPLMGPLRPPLEVSSSSQGSSERGIELGKLFGLDGSTDADGKVRACPALTFPRLIPQLRNLYHFRRLADIFQKDPNGTRRASASTASLDRTGGGQSHSTQLVSLGVAGNTGPSPGSPSTAPTNHEYAHAYEDANNIGSQADFNLWSPHVQEDDEFSLAQLWVTRGSYNDNSLQTVEAGWQVSRQLYGDSIAHLFIYSTSGAYNSGTGCYNLDCSRFVQTNSTVVIGGSFTSYSSVGGPQYDITVLVYRDPASQNWWLKLNNTWVGYYPNSLFNDTGLANFSDKIDFGGEIVNDAVGGVHTSTQMGSGHFPGEGWQHAAYIKRIQYWDTAGNGYNAGGLTPDVTDNSFYDLALSSSTDTNWSTYFYFGGPGGIGSSCTYSIQPTSANAIGSGGTGVVSVQASDASCTWSSAADAGWLHVTSGASGTGNGTVGYSVDANSGSARSGTLTIAGQTFTVNQAGGSVSYAYS
ncbi:MAG: neprosin family prolyl endopeptidase, partial [Terriglobales bacterium]